MNFKNIEKRIIEKYDREKINIGRKLFEVKMKISGNERPSSEPYISSDTFRAHSNHIFDKVDKNTPVPNIKKADIIFVNNSFIKEFFKYIHPNIKKNYILLTHDGIEPVNEKYIEYINDNKIIHWFGKNVLIDHQKVTPIPIGLENLFCYGTGITKMFNKLRKNLDKTERKNQIIYKFKVATNPAERQKAYDYLQTNPIAEEIETKLNPYRYFQRISQYKFTASPPGAGEECHRTWEALYLNTIPTVPRSIATNYFEKLGLPIWNIDSWHELDGLTENDLEKKYSEIINKANFEPLQFDYWWNIIKEKQNEYLKKN